MELCIPIRISIQFFPGQINSLINSEIPRRYTTLEIQTKPLCKICQPLCDSLALGGIKGVVRLGCVVLGFKKEFELGWEGRNGLDGTSYVTRLGSRYRRLNWMAAVLPFLSSLAPGIRIYNQVTTSSLVTQKKIRMNTHSASLNIEINRQLLRMTTKRDMMRMGSEHTNSLHIPSTLQRHRAIVKLDYIYLLH